MTVCVAAICQKAMIICASDRMLTAGDIQFEPQQPKVWVLPPSILMLSAGDPGLHAEVFYRISDEVRGRGEEEAGNLAVGEIADLYSRFCGEALLRRAEIAVLSPHGLSADTFIARQKEMEPSFIERTASKMENFQSLEHVEVIICGVDQVGTHVYVVEDEKITCRDPVGFAAVGAGGGHADSQMMLGGHTNGKSFAETLLLTYLAKKRAEVAPGVGEATDMFVIGPGRSFTLLSPTHFDRLHAEYKKVARAEARANQRGKERISEYIEGVLKSITAQQAQPAPPPTAEGDKKKRKKQSNSSRKPQGPST